MLPGKQELLLRCWFGNRSSMCKRDGVCNQCH